MSSRIQIRRALATDAAAAVRVLRESITRLCVADHEQDPARLAEWLANKTVEHFERWLSASDLTVIVAELAGDVRGVASFGHTGQVRLCYVEPGYERLGVGQAMLDDLEARARSLGVAQLSLQSTLNARSFYERNGYVSTGAPDCALGTMRCYPYRKALVDDGS